MHQHAHITDFFERWRNALQHAVREYAAVHENCAQSGDETADFGISQHHLPVLDLRHRPPIGLYVLHTMTYIAAAKQ